METTTECDGGRRTQLEFSVGLGLDSRLLREVVRSIDGNNSHSFLRQEQQDHSDEP